MNAKTKTSSEIRHMGPTPMGGSVSGRQRSLRLLAFSSFRQSHRRCRRAVPGPSFTTPQARPWQPKNQRTKEPKNQLRALGKASGVEFDFPEPGTRKPETVAFRPCSLCLEPGPWQPTNEKTNEPIFPLVLGLFPEPEPGNPKPY